MNPMSENWPPVRTVPIVALVLVTFLTLAGCVRTPDMSGMSIQPDRSLETMNPRARTLAEIDPEEKLRLLVDHAPLIWLAKHEKYMPSSVEWAFDHFERHLHEGRYWLQTRDRLSSPSDASLELFQGDLETAPVYAFAVGKGGFLDLVYFVYYPYNRGKEMLNTIWGNHVGDWEHVTVRLAQESLQPIGLYVSTHDLGGAFRWSDVPKQGSHPIVYAAWGSHGFWLEPGDHTYKEIGPGGIIAELVDEVSKGTRWESWNNILTLDYSAKTGLGDDVWPRWMSTDYADPGEGDPSNPAAGPIFRWGNRADGCGLPEEITGECRLNNGPTGPAQKGVWNPDRFN